MSRYLSRTSVVFLPLGIFALALSINVLHVAVADWGAGLISPFGRSDAYYYLHRAWYAAFVNINGGEVSTAVPLSIYAWIQAWAYRVFGPYAWVPFIVNALLVSASAAFVAMTTRNFFDEKSGWAAGAVVALAGPLVFFAGVTVKTNVEVFLLGGGIYAASIYFCRRSRIALALAIYFLVLLTIPRNNMLVVALLLVGLVLWMARGRPWTRLGGDLLAISVGVAAFLFVTSWNVATLEQPHFSPIGVNFYVGNAPSSVGTYTDIVGINNDLLGHHSDTISVAESRAGKKLSSWEVSEYWFKESFRYVRDNPAQYARLQARKIVMLFAHAAHGLPEQYTLWRWERPALAIAFLDFGMVLSLYLAGIALSWPRRHEPTWVLLVIGNVLYAVTVWVFFIGERYRIPMIILMAPFAGYAITSLTRPGAIKIAGALIAIYLTTLALSEFNAEGPGWSRDARAARQDEVNRHQVEWHGYQLKQDAVLSNKPQAWAMVSMDLSRRQLHHDAEEIAQKAISMGPDDPELYWNLARQLLRRRDSNGIEKLLNRLTHMPRQGARVTALSQELVRWLQENREKPL